MVGFMSEQEHAWSHSWPVPVVDIKIWFISGLVTKYMIAQNVLSVCDDP